MILPTPCLCRPCVFLPWTDGQETETRVRGICDDDLYHTHHVFFWPAPDLCLQTYTDFPQACDFQIIHYLRVCPLPVLNSPDPARSKPLFCKRTHAHTQRSRCCVACYAFPKPGPTHRAQFLSRTHLFAFCSPSLLNTPPPFFSVLLSLLARLRASKHYFSTQHGHAPPCRWLLSVAGGPPPNLAASFVAPKYHKNMYRCPPPPPTPTRSHLGCVPVAPFVPLPLNTPEEKAPAPLNGGPRRTRLCPLP
jgi:hypothetical protein